jgi:hypothetical protein
LSHAPISVRMLGCNDPSVWSRRRTSRARRACCHPRRSGSLLSPLSSTATGEAGAVAGVRAVSAAVQAVSAAAAAGLGAAGPAATGPVSGTRLGRCKLNPV